jgi:hypothetical protein
MEKNNNSKTSKKELNDSAKVTAPFRLPPEESKSTIVQKPFYIKDENSSQTPSTNKQEKKEKTLYQILNESKFGSYLDWADLALDCLSLVPGPVGWLAGVAGTVTGIPQGLLAAHDIYKNGLNANNFTDVMKLVPMGSLMGKSSNAGLKLIGKTNKYARRAHPYFNTAVEGGINMVRRNKKYFPYFAPIWGMDAFNIGTDIAHIASNKDGGNIKIKDKNKGKFTASAKAHGMGV